MESTLLETPDEEAVVGIPMTRQRFLSWNPDDGFLYEFENGLAIPTDGMKNVERPIIQKILRKFTQTVAYQQMGEILPETKCWLNDGQMRIPDAAFFTSSQIQDSGADKHPIPSFVIEIISPSDKVKPVEQKVIEYFDAGVQVVWHIHPALRMVRVFTSARQNVTCFENDEFGAAPAIPDLHITVAELFS
ncbi:hypothetical protein BH09BAC4_BH09BAC4_51710 [soil metagenome]